MPAWIQSVSFVSPIRWAMLAIEGGVWRNFSIAEMAAPCAALIALGMVCFAIGTRGLKEA
jgi:ABC-2 type transport system permease protein